MESSTTYQPEKSIVEPTDKSTDEKAKGNVAEPIGDSEKNKGNTVNEPPKPIVAAPESVPVQK